MKSALMIGFCIIAAPQWALAHPSGSAVAQHGLEHAWLHAWLMVAGVCFAALGYALWRARTKVGGVAR